MNKIILTTFTDPMMGLTYVEAGHFGDIMATACKVRGIAGVVIDGSCRDAQDIVELGLPVFVRGLNPYGTVKESLAKLNVPVRCGGVEVRHGDTSLPQAALHCKARIDSEKRILPN